jgi:transposase
MIPSGVQIFVAVEPVDMRWSFDRLAGVARERIGYDVRGGALFLFFGKRRGALKLLFCDASGMCLFYKRLDRGQFRVLGPLETGARHIEIDESALDALLDGVDVERGQSRKSRMRVH